MSPGELIAGRFELGTLAGAGGSGSVYRGQDRLSGAPVAVKLLSDLGTDGVQRFTREATLLAKLSHPHIVRYVAHGELDARRHYLVTEWLEGETLSQRLRRLRLSIAETMLFAERVAGAIALAHSRGIIHRDLKPANIFLEECHPGRPKVLDFGLARPIHMGAHVTQTGVRVGTPAYMSPEQAQGVKELDARTDVFSLGTVLYACLAGSSPFYDDEALGIMARVVLHEPQALVELRHDVPSGLSSLIARMLSKPLEQRPRDAGEVLALLSSLAVETTPTPRSPVLTTQERRVLCAVMAELRPGDDDPTWTRERQKEMGLDLAEKLGPRGGTVERLGDSAFLITFSGASTAKEQACEAARAARELDTILPRAGIAVATGRAVIEGRLPTGDVIDRLVKDLIPAAREDKTIRIDELTARLIEHRFEVAATATGWTLGEERDELDMPERLLGKPLPFVGRAQVMSILRAYLDECIDESVSRAVLVTGPAGRGKSRLCRELLTAMEAREEVRVLFARGEVLGGRSAFGLARQLLRRTQIDPAVQRSLGKRDLGALLRLSDLATAKERPATGDASRAAWVRWLEEEAAHAPVLLVLEDFHYGDWPSMDLIDAALKRLADAPLMVLAFARPEVRDLFPSLWEDRDLQELKLSPLPKRACVQMIRAVVGNELDDEVIGELIARSEGNVFLLEELVRAVHAQQTLSVPDTILGVLEARISALPAEAKRVLRAASIYGVRFSRTALLALLGGEDAARAVDGDLKILVERELLQEVKPRFPSQRRFTFRHELLREAAYAMLTDEDRALGHRLAGEYLEQEGLSDPLVLAEHFDRGGEPLRASAWYLKAAEAALFANDMNAIIERADLGMRCGASGDALVQLLVLRAEANHWKGNPKDTVESAERALELVTPGSRLWFQAADSAFVGYFRLGRADEGRAWVMRIHATEPVDQRAFNAKLASLARAAIVLERGGVAQPAQIFRLEVLRIAESSQALEPRAAMLVEEVRFLEARHQADVETCIRASERAIELAESTSDMRTSIFAQLSLQGMYFELGHTREIVDAVAKLVEDAERANVAFVAAYCRMAFASGMIHLDPNVARAHAEAALAKFRDKSLGSFTRVVIGRCLLVEGDPIRAEKELRTAYEFLQHVGSEGAIILGHLAEALLAQGRNADALAAAEEALSRYVPHDGLKMGESGIYASLVEALMAHDRRADAKKRRHEGIERLETRARRIQDPDLRRSFREGVAENARLLALAL